MQTRPRPSSMIAGGTIQRRVRVSLRIIEGMEHDHPLCYGPNAMSFAPSASLAVT